MPDNPERNEVWWVYSTQDKMWAGLRIATVIPASPAHGELFVIHNEVGPRVGVRAWDDVSEREGWVKVKKIDVPTSEDIIATLARGTA